MFPPKAPLGATLGASFAGLDSRSATILRELVEIYVQTGEPVGSRTLSRRLPHALSPATIRNVMADLEDAGLLFAPHTSAGRLPTERGLRLFVDGLLQFGALAEEERDAISARCAAGGRSLQETLGEAGQMLSGLAGAAAGLRRTRLGWLWRALLLAPGHRRWRDAGRFVRSRCLRGGARRAWACWRCHRRWLQACRPTLVSCRSSLNRRCRPWRRRRHRHL